MLVQADELRIEVGFDRALENHAAGAAVGYAIDGATAAFQGDAGWRGPQLRELDLKAIAGRAVDAAMPESSRAF